MSDISLERLNRYVSGLESGDAFERRDAIESLALHTQERLGFRWCGDDAQRDRAVRRWRRWLRRETRKRAGLVGGGPGGLPPGGISATAGIALPPGFQPADGAPLPPGLAGALAAFAGVSGVSGDGGEDVPTVLPPGVTSVSASIQVLPDGSIDKSALEALLAKLPVEHKKALMKQVLAKVASAHLAGLGKPVCEACERRPATAMLTRRLDDGTYERLRLCEPCVHSGGG